MGVFYTRPKGQEKQWEDNTMDSIKVTYKLERFDSAHWHGWIVWECSEGMESEYFSSTSYEDAHAVFSDLHPETL